MNLTRTDAEFNTLINYLTETDKEKIYIALFGVAKGCSDSLDIPTNIETLKGARDYFNNKALIKVTKFAYKLNDATPVEVDKIVTLTRSFFLYKLSVINGFQDVNIVEDAAGVADIFGWSLIFSEKQSELMKNNVKKINVIGKLARKFALVTCDSSVELGV
jgi:hypothetical protein